MSLILEALKKLDREKQAPDRGVVVVGPAAWASPGDSGFPLKGAVLVAGALAVGGAAGAVWLARRPALPAAPAQPAVAAQRGGPPPPAVASAPSLAPPAVAAVPSNRSRSSRGLPAAPGAAAKAAPDRVPPGESADATSPGEAASPDEATSTDEASSASRETAPSAATPAGEGHARKPGRHGAAPEFELRAISAQNGHPVAVLNDRLVREGDSFDNVKVLRIGADEVEIEVAGKRRIVKF